MVEGKLERKSMSDALTLDSQKLAFIHDGDKHAADRRGAEPAKAPQIEDGASIADHEATVGTESSKVPLIDIAADTTKNRRSRNKNAKLDFADSLAAPSPILVPLTTRITTATAESLRRASLELRLQRRKFAQQDIVEAALRAWLANYGFEHV